MKLIFTYVTTLFLITNYCFSDVFDAIQETNMTRADKYNAQLNVSIDEKDPNDLSKLSVGTGSIYNLLTKNVSKNVYATKEQQKKALQAVFATEIIYGEIRPSYLDGISTTNEIYRHSYILEYSALLVRDYVNSTSGGADISVPTYKKLYSYSGLDNATLFGWFIEMRDKHKLGKRARQERCNSIAYKRIPITSVSFTFRREEGTHKQSCDTSVSGDSGNANWTATYMLKDGRSTVIHTSAGVQIGEMSSCPVIYMPCRNYNGIALNGGLFLDTDSLQIDFVNALLRSGAYEGTTEEKAAYNASGNWTETFTLLDGTQISHTDTTLVIFPNTSDEDRIEDIFANSINNIKFKRMLRLYTKSTRSEFFSALKKEKAI